MLFFALFLFLFLFCFFNHTLASSRSPRCIRLVHGVLDDRHVAPKCVFADFLELFARKLDAGLVYVLVLANRFSRIAPADPRLDSVAQMLLNYSFEYFMLTFDRIIASSLIATAIFCCLNVLK